MRYLLFDRILDIEKGKKVVGLKSFSKSEDIFSFHFPKKAIVPISLIIESIGQLGSWLVKFSLGFNIEPLVGLVKGVEVIKEIQPGSQLLIEVELLSLDAKSSNIAGWVKEDNEIVLKVERILFGHMPVKADSTVYQRFFYLSGLSQEE